MEQENKSSMGSIIGIIIIIAIIILGGLYFWGKRIEEAKTKENLLSNPTTDIATSSSLDAINEVSPGDDLNSIEADLNATDLDNIAPELQ